MDSVHFYRPVQAELCQGDVFERLPLVFLKGTLLPAKLKSANFPGGRTGFDIEQFDPQMPAQSESFKVAADCIYASAILLTYDCDVDKPNAKELTVALVRPLSPLLPADQETIRANRNFSCLHLPQQNELRERFVDFHKIARVPVGIIKAAQRQTSLSDEAWRAFVFQFVRCMTRYELNLDILARP